MKILLKIKILFASIISNLQSSDKKNLLSYRTKKIIKKIEKINELTDSFIGYAGYTSKQWSNFEKLKKCTTNNELIELTNHPNGVVRCYAIWALCYRNDVDLQPIIQSHINDDELIMTQFGCLRYEETVGRFFIKINSPEGDHLRSLKSLRETMYELFYEENY